MTLGTTLLTGRLAFSCGRIANPRRFSGGAPPEPSKAPTDPIKKVILSLGSQPQIPNNPYFAILILA